ncbi:MAG TPA: transketolase [Chitinophagales bacterium]|nr:transketolase [Chitinophagales bacterium]
MAEILELQRIASQVRRDIVRMVGNAKSGHPGGSLGCADLLTALYFDIMKHDTNFNMSGKDEDVFFLSNGHISPVLYSVLARSGYFDVKELSTFRQLNSRLQGHPTTHEGLPGIRIASGSLGQGVSVANGVALAKKMDGDDRTVFVLTGDGELQEGQIWEAVLFAAHNKIDNLILTVDYNNCQIDGTVDQILSLGDLKAKFEAFGWNVLEMDGNKMENVVATLKEAQLQSRKGHPIAILMTTEMGYGVDYMMGTHKWHGNAPNAEQVVSAMSQLEETLGDF